MCKRSIQFARTGLILAGTLAACHVNRGVDQGGEDDRDSVELVADVADAVVKGPCATACAAIISGSCNWREQCTTAEWPEMAWCGEVPNERAMDCLDAEAVALKGGALGLSSCWRTCERLAD